MPLLQQENTEMRLKDGTEMGAAWETEGVRQKKRNGEYLFPKEIIF